MRTQVHDVRDGIAGCQCFRRDPIHPPPVKQCRVVFLHVSDEPRTSCMPSSRPHTALHFHRYHRLRESVVEAPFAGRVKLVFRDGYKPFFFQQGEKDNVTHGSIVYCFGVVGKEWVVFLSVFAKHRIHTFRWVDILKPFTRL